jgi:hypothetical protein
LIVDSKGPLFKLTHQPFSTCAWRHSSCLICTLLLHPQCFERVGPDLLDVVVDGFHRFSSVYLFT